VITITGDGTAGTFTYDPTGSSALQALDAGDSITDTFTYTVSDGTTTDTAVMSITVDGANDGPVGVDDGVGVGGSTTEDTSFTTGNALLNDTDEDGSSSLFISAVTASTQGATLTITGDGTAGTFTLTRPDLQHCRHWMRVTQ
jgi:VCBS repeat-containing protein